MPEKLARALLLRNIVIRSGLETNDPLGAVQRYIQVHFVDLSDHFFKYPFEMLRFSENKWRKWLNPSSNHNRYRLWNYRSVFEACFEQVEIKILASEENEFRKLLPSIRPEFISNNMDENYASLILVI